MPERSDSDDWLLRVDASALVKIALACNEDEAEGYLVDHACDHLSFDWQYRARIKITKILPSAQRLRAKRHALKSMAHASRLRLPNPEEIEHAIRTRFWLEARKGDGHIQIGDNAATYLGPLFLAPVRGEIQFSGRSVSIKNVTLIDPRWRFDIHLSAIRFRARPLVAALRSDGGLVDAGIEQLRAQGRLAVLPHVSDAPASRPSTEQGTVKQDLPATLIQRPPLPGESKKRWAERAMPEHAKAARNFLSRNNGLWEKAMRARTKRSERPGGTQSET